MSDTEYSQILQSEEQLAIANMKREDVSEPIKNQNHNLDDFEEFLSNHVSTKTKRKIYEPQSKIIGSKFRLDSFMEISTKAAERLDSMMPNIA